MCSVHLHTKMREKCAWPCLSFSFLSFVNVSRFPSSLVAWPVFAKFFFNLLPWMWLRAQEKHAFSLTSLLLRTHTRSFLLFIRGAMQRKQTTLEHYIVWILPSSKWFCKEQPLICLLFSKSLYEIIIATCLQQEELSFTNSVPHFFVPFLRAATEHSHIRC